MHAKVFKLFSSNFACHLILCFRKCLDFNVLIFVFYRRKKKCIRVQMYLAGRSEQEIDATQFDEDGEPIPPLHGGHHHHHHSSSSAAAGSAGGHHPSSAVGGSCSSGSTTGSDGDEAGSPGGSIESSETNSIRSPATPGGGCLSIASLGSPASIASPATPGGSGGAEDWFRSNAGFRPPAPNHRPVGTDPRDAKNPLSISSLTSSSSSSSSTPSSYHHHGPQHNSSQQHLPHPQLQHQLHHHQLQLHHHHHRVETTTGHEQQQQKPLLGVT